MTDISFHIDWLTVSVVGDLGVVRDVLALAFPQLMPSADEGWNEGSRGFHKASSIEGVLGLKVYTDAREDSDTYDGSPASGVTQVVVMSGVTCAACSFEQFRDFFEYLNDAELKYRVARIDFAWDGANFSPLQLYEGLQDGLFRSPANHDEIGYHVNKDGTGCTLGSRHSGRYLRVYDKHGFTRVELECKRKWAGALTQELFSHPMSEFGRVSIGLLRDYLDVYKAWWYEFVGENPRLRFTALSGVASASLERKLAWLRVAVCPSLKSLYKAGHLNYVFQSMLETESNKRFDWQLRQIIDL